MRAQVFKRREAGVCFVELPTFTLARISKQTGLYESRKNSLRKDFSVDIPIGSRVRLRFTLWGVTKKKIVFRIL